MDKSIRSTPSIDRSRLKRSRSRAEKAAFFGRKSALARRSPARAPRARGDASNSIGTHRERARYARIFSRPSRAPRDDLDASSARARRHRVPGKDIAEMPATRRRATLANRRATRTSSSDRDERSNDSSASDLVGKATRATRTTRREDGKRRASKGSSGSSGSDLSERAGDERAGALGRRETRRRTRRTVESVKRATPPEARSPNTGSDADDKDGDGARRDDERAKDAKDAKDADAGADVGADDFEVVDLEKVLGEGERVVGVFGRRVRDVAECYVRWEGRSHARNSWVRERDLERACPDILRAFEAQYPRAVLGDPVYAVKRTWLRPQRVVNATGMPPNTRLLVKWWGLPYADCTWETIDGHDDFDMLLERYTQFDHESLKRPYSVPPSLANVDESNKPSKGVQCVARWLLATWFEKEGVCFVDNSPLCKHAEVAANFIADRKRQYDEHGPSLIIAAESELEHWSREFSRIAPDVNVVEYGGSATCRATVQQHEWSFVGALPGATNGVSTPRFNVLITTHSTVVLDIVLLRQVRWESVIMVENAQKFTAETSSLLSRLGSLHANHRVLMFRAADFSDLHVTLNILEFLKRAPTSMRNLEARLLNLSQEEACMQTAALLAVLTMDYQFCEAALRNKQALAEADACMGTLHTARLLELSEIVLASKVAKESDRRSVFPACFDYTSTQYLGLLHQLQALHDMYRPLISAEQR